MRPSALLLLVLALGINLAAGGQSAPSKMGKERGLTRHATGTFAVKIIPAEASAIAKEAAVGRMTIDKKFSGALNGSSKGEMLTAMTDESGSMAYVAIERVTAELDGRSGTFVLMHSATMMKGDGKSAVLNVTVVPASGTSELVGLGGKMNIIIDESGKHSYEFDYTLP